jgi:hypothetical protein
MESVRHPDNPHYFSGSAKPLTASIIEGIKLKLRPFRASRRRAHFLFQERLIPCFSQFSIRLANSSRIDASTACIDIVIFFSRRPARLLYDQALTGFYFLLPLRADSSIMLCM